MEIFTQKDFEQHEQIMYCYDKKSGLKAIIAIHNTTLGPGLGGCRFWNYEDEKEALIDVLRLSKGMSYKAALANLELGGGKAVIIGDARSDKSPELLASFARYVDRLCGSYITAEDVGTTVADMELVSKHTPHVVGLDKNGGSGDPSIFTALGVFQGLKACNKYLTGSDDLKGKHVTIQGLGKVGEDLAKRLRNVGASLTITDIDYTHAKQLAKELGASVVEPDDIYSVKADYFSPCALGAVLSDDTIPRLRVKAVCGSANNQLVRSYHAETLSERGILYAPDFLVNAGGLVNVYYEYNKTYDEAVATSKVEEIYDTLLQILEISERHNTLPLNAAKQLAEERIKVN